MKKAKKNHVWIVETRMKPKKLWHTCKPFRVWAEESSCVRDCGIMEGMYPNWQFHPRKYIAVLAMLACMLAARCEGQEPLLVLSTNSTDIMETNQVFVSCEDVNCTNVTWINSIVVDEPAYTDTNCFSLKGSEWERQYHAANCKCRPAKTHMEKVKARDHVHLTNNIYIAARRDEIVIGTKAKPLFRVMTQTVLSNDYSRLYYEGTWVLPATKKEIK